MAPEYGAAREGAWAESLELQAVHIALESRLRFIREVAEGKINVFALSRDELVDALAQAGYAPSEGGCGYLLSTDIASMTVDGVQRLERERDDTLEGIKAAKASAALYAREQLRARMDALGQRKVRFEEALGTLGRHRETLERDAGALQEEVKTKMAAVEVALSSREAELVMQVGRIEETKKTQLADAREDLQNAAAALTSSIEEVETVLAKSDPYDFLEAAAAVEAAVDEALRRGERGFVVPDASFKLKLNTEPQMTAIRHIGMSDSEVGGVGRAGEHSATQPSPKVRAQVPKDAPSHASPASLSLPAAHPGGDRELQGTDTWSHNGAHERAGGRGGGEMADAVGADGEGGKGAASGGGGGSGGRSVPKVEKTQIHMISPGVSVRACRLLFVCLLACLFVCLCIHLSQGRQRSSSVTLLIVEVCIYDCRRGASAAASSPSPPPSPHRSALPTNTRRDSSGVTGTEARARRTLAGWLPGVRRL
jgi:hypothetical protein